MLKVTVFLHSTLPHFSQLLTGLEVLASNKIIALDYKLDPGRCPVNILRLKIGKKNVFFDLADNSKIDLSLYSKCDHYVKRMLLKRDYEEMEKLIPYGLYYPVYLKNKKLKFLFLKKPSWWKYSVRYWPLLAEILNLRDSISTNDLNRMQSKPADGQRIIFRSRLWDAGETHPEWKRLKRRHLNEQRLEINRRMGQKFGSDFVGGIRRDVYSEGVSPDLLLSSAHFHRKNYLEALRCSSIGISSPGLEESVGAKFGEYLAFGLAVVTNSVEQYQFLGPLKEGKHYLQYESPAECVEKALSLHCNERFRRDMQQENLKYYNDWLHPAQKVKKIIQLIQDK